MVVGPTPPGTGVMSRARRAAAGYSIVRRGLEEERDALPGLISAIGHTPVRFEDFTAQTVPSREACIAGVDSSDAYLLLIGPHYGEPMKDTGQSPTHDEWMASRSASSRRHRSFEALRGSGTAQPYGSRIRREDEKNGESGDFGLTGVVQVKSSRCPGSHAADLLNRDASQVSGW
jgi:hypothetical protein